MELKDPCYSLVYGQIYSTIIRNLHCRFLNNTVNTAEDILAGAFYYLETCLISAQSTFLGPTFISRCPAVNQYNFIICPALLIHISLMPSILSPTANISTTSISVSINLCVSALELAAYFVCNSEEEGEKHPGLYSFSLYYFQ